MPRFKVRLHHWFPNLSWRTYNTARFLCLPNETHLIQLIIMSWWVESGMLHTTSFSTKNRNLYAWMIRRPWWTEATGQIWPGCYTRHTLLKDILGFFCDHRKSGPRFDVSSEGWCSLTV